jgi:hypothetical protein
MSQGVSTFAATLNAYAELLSLRGVTECQLRRFRLQTLELATDLFLGLAQPLLQTAEQLVVLTLGKG